MTPFQAFKGAIQREPNNADAHFNMGLLNLSLGNKVGAYAESLNLRRMNPALAHQLDALSSPPRTPSTDIYGRKYYRVYQP